MRRSWAWPTLIGLIGKFMKLSSFVFASVLVMGVTSIASAQAPASSAATDNAANLALLSGPGPLHIQKLTPVDTQVGTGDEVKNGDLVEVHYTGWMYNNKAPNLHGAKFDSSRDAGTPFTFLVGGRQVIRGWDMGVMGMKVGGKRTLLIPAYLAYSTQGSGSIPPNTHLVF
jgi:FKBP-type peptidyl-prolyl cis-trans isomerase FkpA